TRRIRVSRALIREHASPIVLEVLAHEMAHQFVLEVLGVEHEGPHGPTFTEVCRTRRTDATACRPPAPPVAAAPEQRPLRKVRRLLALADSRNPHEAQAAMDAAHRLMRKHNIERVEASAESRYGWRLLGEPALRHDTHIKVLAGL